MGLGQGVSSVRVSNEKFSDWSRGEIREGVKDKFSKRVKGWVQ